MPRLVVRSAQRVEVLGDERQAGTKGLCVVPETDPDEALHAQGAARREHHTAGTLDETDTELAGGQVGVVAQQGDRATLRTGPRDT